MILGLCVHQKTTPILETGVHSIIGFYSPLHSTRVTVREAGSKDGEIKKRIIFLLPLRIHPSIRVPRTSTHMLSESTPNLPPFLFLPPQSQLLWFILLLTLCMCHTFPDVHLLVISDLKICTFGMDISIWSP